MPLAAPITRQRQAVRERLKPALEKRIKRAETIMSHALDLAEGTVKDENFLHPRFSEEEIRDAEKFITEHGLGKPVDSIAFTDPDGDPIQVQVKGVVATSVPLLTEPARSNQATGLTNDNVGNS